MSKPLVTVILPSLNVKDYIEICMDSVIGQSLYELEILCIDAGSTDGTLDILRKYELLDQRVKVIHSNVKSYGKQINMGINLATGKYVAIVETDDYIDQCMYEKLYDIAEEKRLDYVKADFKGFHTLHNGQKVYDEGRVWENEEVYGKVLTVEEFPELYMRDVNIWKGIYNRDFLINNGIRLSETAGAAFQDIGFCMLLLLNARRGMYVRDMFYYYRRDNDNSSSNKPYGLRFAYQEFERLLNLTILVGNKELFYRYLYIRMAHVFVGEYEKLLFYDEKIDIEFHRIINWFQKALNREVDKKGIMKADFGDSIWRKLCLLMDDEESYVEEWHISQKKQNAEEQDLLNRIGTDKAVIFGCGYYGREALLFCDRHKIDIAAFSDNNSDLWGDKYCGYEILKPSRLQIEYSDVKVVISTEKYERVISNQLLELGISRERILSYKVRN